MATTHVKVPMGKIMSQVTMNVDLTGMKVFRVRMWIGRQLLKLVALAMGCKIQVETDGVKP